MASVSSLRQLTVGRSVFIAYAVIVGLYLARHIRFQPLQIPAYLFIATYDLIELFVPVLGPFHPIAFPVFLYLLAVGVGAVSRATQREVGVDVTVTVGGVAVLIALLSFLFAAVVRGPLVSPTDNPTPLAITTTTGLVLGLLGWWLLRDRSA